nr:unnamed protein product [Callosobruchus analis]
MLYANEHRKIMAQQHPADSNKEISRKLGKTWKQLDIKQKAVYFEKANSISVEHKKKYPGKYVKISMGSLPVSR